MKNNTISICDANIHPGEKTTLALPLPEIYSCTPMYMPIKVINGKKPGKCFLGFATMRGNDFNGLEVLNKIFDLVQPDNLCGSLIIVPVLNIYGLTHYPHMSPSTEENITQGFPGLENGNFNERIAYVFTKEILKKADYCLEIKSGATNHKILPQIYCNLENPEAKKLAKAFQAPVITEVETNASKLRETTEQLNIPLIVYEAGEARRFDQIAIQTGVDGITNMLKALNMIDGNVAYSISPVYSRDHDWQLSPSSGIMRTLVDFGEKIAKGQKICTLSDPFSNESNLTVKTDMAGIVVGINQSPLIREGEPIFKLASFLDNEKAKALIEEWGEESAEIITDK